MTRRQDGYTRIGLALTSCLSRWSARSECLYCRPSLVLYDSADCGEIKKARGVPGPTKTDEVKTRPGWQVAGCSIAIPILSTSGRTIISSCGTERTQSVPIDPSV